MAHIATVVRNAWRPASGISRLPSMISWDCLDLAARQHKVQGHLQGRIAHASLSRRSISYSKQGRSPAASSSTSQSQAQSQSGAHRPRQKLRSMLHTEGLTWSEMTGGQRFVYFVKQIGYTGVIAFGFAIFCGATYYTATELMDNHILSQVFRRSMEKIEDNEKLCKILGTPIHGYDSVDYGGIAGHKAKEGQRKMVRHFFEENGKRQLLLRFQVNGPLQSGMANGHLIKNNETGEWEFHTLFVESSSTHERIFLVDNRVRTIVKREPQRVGWFGLIKRPQ
ncbi:TIM21-domain-containing protein [Polychytrium aggregatum]|uniref:TIM21-domain-containing protein n=1 Tax=Polychytrium aggregatum TaxID=110093 RepID=UPI0022FDEFD4|nr:TIM21-domain-containing protein [Polychytrium aggregatum]KAI9199423.1 TIM21-domain-containing protein [Polychytrium aggregatum]